MLDQHEVFDSTIFIIDKKKTWTRYEVCFNLPCEDLPYEKQMEFLNKGFSPALPLSMPEHPDWIWECEYYAWPITFGLAYPINYTLYQGYYECDEE